MGFGSRGRRISVLTAFAALAVLLGACSSSKTSRTDTTGSTVSANNSTTSAPANASSDAYGGYFPGAVGTTWVYRATGALTDTLTVKITAASTNADGDRSITLHESSAGHSSTDHDVTYIFRKDGSVSIPYQGFSFGSRGIQVAYQGDGNIAWPSVSDLTTGRTKSGQISATITLPGRAPDALSVQWTSTPGGAAHVVVPAGSYDTVVVSVDARPSTGGDLVTTTYLARGVGPVKSDAAGVVSELVSYTPGA